MTLPRTVVVALLAVFAVAGEAVAQPQPVSDARLLALFREGRSLMDARRFSEAITRFEEVLAVRESAGARFNLGLSLSALQRCREATAAFERVAATDTDESRRESARVNLDELRGCVARVTVDLRGHPTELRVDGAVTTLHGEREVLTLDPGDHVFEARRDGYQAARETATVTRGEQRVLVLEVRPRVVIAPPRRESEIAPRQPFAVAPPRSTELRSEGGIGTRWWFWTLIGVAVAGGTVGILAATGALDREGPGLTGSWGNTTAAIRWR